MRMMRSNPTTAGPLVKRVTKVDELISLFFRKNWFCELFLEVTLALRVLLYIDQKSHS